MSRGLGRNQRAVVKAMEALQAEHGPGWVAPAKIITEIERPGRQGRAHALRMTVALIEARTAAERGDPAAAALVARLEAEGASTTFRASAAVTLAKPKVRRPRRRAGEELNPARIFAALEERGIVERRPCVGPASRVRLV